MVSSTTKLRNKWKENEPEKYQAYLERQRLLGKRRREEKKKKGAEEDDTKAMKGQRERKIIIKRMVSSTTKLRNKWKENEPEKYQAYLERQRRLGKRRRDEKKRKWAEAGHTKAMKEQRERELMIRREKDRRYREKKGAVKKHGKDDPSVKRRRDMTEEERRQHDARVRTEYNHRLSCCKRNANNKKNRERMRAARKKEAEKGEQRGTMNLEYNHSLSHQKKSVNNNKNKKIMRATMKEEVEQRGTVEGFLNLLKLVPKRLLDVGSQNTGMDNISDVTIGPCENSKYIQPKRIHYKQNGVAKIWDAMKVHDGVAVLLFNSSRKVFIFVRQFRPAIYIATAKIETKDGVDTIDTEKYPGHLGLTLELCAGIVDKDEPVSTIAKGEILEECGYDVPMENIIKITSARGGVGTSGSVVHLLYAEVTDAMKTGPGGGLASEGEMIEVVEMSVEEGRALMFDDSCNRVHLLIFALYWFFGTVWHNRS